MFSSRRLIMAKLSSGFMPARLHARFFGRTPLHDLVRTCRHPDEVRSFIVSTPADEAIRMARTVDDSGNIPLDLMRDSGLQGSEFMKVRNMLCRVLMQYRINTLSYRICVDTTLANEYRHASPELRENIKIACLAANAAREGIKYSCSHTDMNHLDSAEQDKSVAITKAMRKMVSYEHPEMIAKLCRLLEISSCCEFSHSAIDYLSREVSKPLHANILSISKGDHMFVAFGDKQLTDPNQYACVDPATVFCDPWAGVVGRYDRETLSKSLGNYRGLDAVYGRSLNVVTTFNPRYHSLASQRSFSLFGSRERVPDKLVDDEIIACFAKMIKNELRK